MLILKLKDWQRNGLLFLKSRSTPGDFCSVDRSAGWGYIDHAQKRDLRFPVRRMVATACHGRLTTDALFGGDKREFCAA
ncbi:MAG TPA: hypothetical protein VK642_01805 [Burkholderiales bacterium]|nr:hypothetical protein [Burkholderiales bacterium]